MCTPRSDINQNIKNTTDECQSTDHQLSVVFKGDGEPKRLTDMIGALSDMESSGELEVDSYSLGGTVGRLERTLAVMLGKEEAVFMPTGTLANHLALRKLCGVRRRAVVQYESHQYNDTGDCATWLSGITLIPLAESRPYFTLNELEREVKRSESGRVAIPLGAVMVESPVRRQYGQVMPYDEMEAVTQFCEDRGIGTHLDAARLYMMTTATGVTAQAYTDLFDTVYVSLYKYFGSPFGAILAGKSEMMEGLYHQRRMFGGGLASAYLAAALALKGILGFEARFSAAMEKASTLFDLLSDLKGITIRRYENGSNIFPVHLDTDVDVELFQAALRERWIFIYPDETVADRLHLTVNTSILRVANDDLVNSFDYALHRARSN